MSILKVKDLRVQYRTSRGMARAVDGISFTIQNQETLGLIGESGCGKSTTAMAIMRLIREPGIIDGGAVLYGDKDLLTLPEEEMRDVRGCTVAIVRQEAQNALNPVMRVGEQIAEIIMVHESCGKKEALRRAGEQLVLVGLDPGRLRSYPHEFSGGMKQRVMIAIATACRPSLLILDEPITGLDVIVQRQLLMLLKSLRADLGLTALFIAHDLSVVSETCENVAVMYGGKIMERGPVDDLFADPMHPYSRALIGSYPSIRGDRQELKSIPGNPPDLVHPPAGCPFAERCTSVMDVCRREVPEDRNENGRYVSCHLYK